MLGISYYENEFKYRADGTPEVMDCSYYGISDHLSLMQYYGVYTNLMDWSEDAFTGLYFVSEKLIIHEKQLSGTGKYRPKSSLMLSS